MRRQTNSSDGATLMEMGEQTLSSLTKKPASTADRKSTRLNSSHDQISYAVFCLKKKNTHAKEPRWCEGQWRSTPQDTHTWTVAKRWLVQTARRKSAREYRRSELARCTGGTSAAC